MVDEPPASAEQDSYRQASAISNRMVRLYVKYVGRGPTKARTTLNTNVVLVVFGETMTRAEQNLVAAGEGEAVRAMRRTLQRSMRAEAVAAIEEVLEREVIAYLSDIDPAVNVGAIVFTLQPLPETGHAEVADSD